MIVSEEIYLLFQKHNKLFGRIWATNRVFG